jgi:hypothetical protein
MRDVIAVKPILKSQYWFWLMFKVVVCRSLRCPLSLGEVELREICHSYFSSQLAAILPEL